MRVIGEFNIWQFIRIVYCACTLDKNLAIFNLAVDSPIAKSPKYVGEFSYFNVSVSFSLQVAFASTNTCFGSITC